MMTAPKPLTFLGWLDKYGYAAPENFTQKAQLVGSYNEWKQLGEPPVVKPMVPDHGLHFEFPAIHNFQKGDSSVERTLVLLKPDAFERGLIGEIIDMLDRRGLRIIATKLFVMTHEQCQLHYKHHAHKDFWPELVDFMTTGPSLAIVYEGEQACAAVRQLIGQKHPSQSPAGSIRGKYAMEFPRNLIHGSDHQEDANEEISLYFTPDEIYDEKYVKKMDKINAEKKAKANLAKLSKLEEGAKLGEVIEYPQMVQIGDVLGYGPYFHKVESITADSGIWGFGLSILNYSEEKIYPKYTEDSWQESGLLNGWEWILVERDGEVAEGWTIPDSNSLDLVNHNFTLLNPNGDDISGGYLQNPSDVFISTSNLISTAKTHKMEAEQEGYPFVLYDNGVAFMQHDGVNQKLL